MNLSPVKLECQKLGASKELSFGCIVELGGDDIDVCTGSCGEDKIFGNMYKILDKGWISEIIGHPITRGRLEYLYRKNNKTYGDFGFIKYYLNDNPELYNQSILDRPDEFCESKVLPFLKSLGKQ